MEMRRKKMSKKKKTDKELNEEITFGESIVKEIPTIKVREFKVVAHKLNLRSEPNKTSNIKTILLKNQLLNVISIDGDWASVVLSDDKSKYGYVILSAITEV